MHYELLIVYCKMKATKRGTLVVLCHRLQREKQTKGKQIAVL